MIFNVSNITNELKDVVEKTTPSEKIFSISLKHFIENGGDVAVEH